MRQWRGHHIRTRVRVDFKYFLAFLMQNLVFNFKPKYNINIVLKINKRILESNLSNFLKISY
jgi:hypothetical protein